MANVDSQPDGQNHDRLQLPLVIYGSSALGNLFEAPTAERKLEITRAWMDNGSPNVVIDSAGKYGAGLALECMGNNLRALDVAPDDVTISNKLGWYRVPLRTPEPTFEPGAWIDIEHDAEQRISRQGILDCWEQGCKLLGEPYRPQLVSVHDPDDYLAAASDEADADRRRQDLLDAYEALAELRKAGHTQFIGVGSKDWQVARYIAEHVSLDWVMIANSLTVYTHSADLLQWINKLASQGVAVINSAVFNAGFLVGGDFFDYRKLSPDSADDRPRFAWREKFLELCKRRGVSPVAACIHFGLSPPSVQAIALNTSSPGRVAQNLAMARTALSDEFWAEAKQLQLVADDYPHVG